MNTYIIGHLKPDTDAVVSAMALEYLFKQAACFGYESPMATITEELNPETTYLFEKFSVASPMIISSSKIKPEDKVVLVDHNEANQQLEGLNPDQIVEIIDHHKVNLNLSSPIFLTFKTWGSTSTIIYYLMKQNQVVPDKTLASLMLAALLSDTVGYKSATTTDKDREIGKELADLAEIQDVEAFTLEIFKAKSNTAALSDNQIVKNDYKVFEFAKKTLINQIETVDPDEILKRKDGLLKAMAQLKEEEQVELVYCAISDILQVNTKLLMLSDAEVKFAEAAFGGTSDAKILDIGAKLSRKKEIAPPLEKAIS